MNLGPKRSAVIAPSDNITVNLDYRQMGVGRDDRWEPPIHKAFYCRTRHEIKSLLELVRVR